MFLCLKFKILFGPSRAICSFGTIVRGFAALTHGYSNVPPSGELFRIVVRESLTCQRFLGSVLRRPCGRWRALDPTEIEFEHALMHDSGKIRDWLRAHDSPENENE